MSERTPDPQSPQPGAKRKFGLSIWACAIFIALFPLALFLHKSMESRDRETCRTNLTRISLALRAYHDKYGSFPPAYVLGPNDKPYHSWRVLLLPFLGENELYLQYHFDEPWDGPHNKTLARRMPELFACPGTTAREDGVTNFVAVVGRATAWPKQYSARLQDFVDRPSETIQLVSGIFRVNWLEPRDIEASAALYIHAMWSEPGKNRDFLAGMADGTTRRITREVSRDNFRSLLSINGGRPLAGVDWPRDAPASEVDLPASRPAEELAHTDVYPYPTERIVSGRNYIYCATFEIAWERARLTLGGGPLLLTGNPPLAVELNRHAFDRRNLSEDSYLASAGTGNAEFRDRLGKELSRKFPGVEPLLVDPDTKDHVLQIYAYLRKTLPFSVTFDKLYAPLRFPEGSRHIEVTSFGAPSPRLDEARAELMESQVTILDYVSDNDFVLRLAPENPQEEIVLAKIVPATTLEETITAVRKRIAKPDPQHTDTHFLSTEPLAIPKLTANLSRRYTEIIKRDIAGTDLYISEALQIIKFQLSENGAVLESEAVLLGDNGHVPHTPAGQRKFIFDRPFLIYLIERDADQPYFVAWIENTELMEPVAQ